MQCNPQLYASFDGEASRYVEDSSRFLYAVHKYMRFLENSIKGGWALDIDVHLRFESRMGQKRYNLFSSGIVVLLPRVGDVPQHMQDVVLHLRDDGQHLN
jgi:hypothetical protein